MLESPQTADFLGDFAMEGVVLKIDESEEGEIGEMRRERAYQTLRWQVYSDNSTEMSAAADDASPVAEMECLVP